MLKNLAVFSLFLLIIISLFFLIGDIEKPIITSLQNLQNQKIRFSFISFIFLSCDVVLPIPSSLIMFFNGFVLGSFIGSVVSLLSLMLSALIGYYLGVLTFKSLKPKEDQRANEIIAKYGFLAILMTRGIPIVSESICAACGYNRMPLKSYLVLNFIGYFPLCLLYSFFGSIGYEKNVFLYSFGCSLLISASFWFIGKKYYSKLICM